MGQPKTVDFYRCARQVQDRFVAATARATSPAPLLFKSARRTRAWSLLAASVVAFLVAVLFLIQGWGDVSSSLALHGNALLGVDVALFSAAAYCFVHAAAVLRAVEALPFRAGYYLFPASVIDASGPALRVWSVADVTSLERLPAPALALQMRDGQRVVVPAERGEDVDRAEAALTKVRPDLARALADEDTDMLAELDPLHPTRVSSPISSTQAMSRYAPLWMRFDWILALAVGAVMGLGLGAMRNATSDERMYRVVSAASDIPLFRRYLERGGEHAAEIRDELLPRAELKAVQNQAQAAGGGVELLQAFAREHTSVPVQPDIAAAMRRALLVELDKAKAAGTVSALDEFARRFPEHVVDAELDSARHALYAKAFTAWRAKASVDAATSAFVERLLGVAEKAGAACEVRFRRKPSKSIDEADKRIAKNVNYPGSDALPSHYVTAEVLKPREQRVAQAVADGFGAAFPADVLAMHPGETLAGDAPAPSAPVLTVDYSPEWSGLNTNGVKPKTIYAGVRFDFDVRFTLPEGSPFALTVKSVRGPELWKLKNTNAGLAEFELKVYEQMIDHEFDDLQKRLLDAFF